MWAKKWGVRGAPGRWRSTAGVVLSTSSRVEPIVILNLGHRQEATGSPPEEASRDDASRSAHVGLGPLNDSSPHHDEEGFLFFLMSLWLGLSGVLSLPTPSPGHPLPLPLPTPIPNFLLRLGYHRVDSCDRLRLLASLASCSAASFMIS